MAPVYELSRFPSCKQIYNLQKFLFYFFYFPGLRGMFNEQELRLWRDQEPDETLFTEI